MRTSGRRRSADGESGEKKREHKAGEMTFSPLNLTRVSAKPSAKGVALAEKGRFKKGASQAPSCIAKKRLDISGSRKEIDAHHQNDEFIPRRKSRAITALPANVSNAKEPMQIQGTWWRAEMEPMMHIAHFPSRASFSFDQRALACTVGAAGIRSIADSNVAACFLFLLAISVHSVVRHPLRWFPSCSPQ